MQKSTTGLLLGSALVVGLAGCATPNSNPSSDRPWYQQPITCGIAGGLIGGSVGYATAGSSDEENNAVVGAAVGAAAAALLCADRSPEPVAEPEPMPEPEPVPEFEPVVLSSEVDNEVNFKFDSSDLLPQAMSTLDEVARRLREHTEVNVRIDGHTDSVGTNEYNMGLSQRRADSVRDYLVSQGVSGDRMIATGYGEERPIATNETKEGRAMNRRVEIDRQ